jgi:DNA transformation protein
MVACATRAWFRRPIRQAEIAARFVMPDAGRMPVSREFLGHIADQLSSFGPIAIRPMFGAAGLYRAGLLFGLVIRDVLYFKVGDGNRADYLAAGAKPFVHRRRGAAAAPFSYYEVPAAVLDDPDQLVEWARAACAAAAAKSAAPRKTKRKPRKT